MRDARCRAWQSSWRTQVLESSPTEQRSNGESYSKAADTAPFSSPLFSEDFVNSLRESLRRTPTVSEPAPRAEPEPAAASWRSASGNGNGNGSQSWRSASSSSRDTNAGSSNGNGNGSGAPAKTSFASWRSVAEAEVESPAAEPEAAGAPSGLRFNDSFKAALSSSSLMRGGPSAYSSGSDVSGADTQTEEEEEADEQAPAAAGLFTPAFKEALQSALARSPLYGTPLLDSVTPDSKYEQDVTPAPTNSVAGSLAGASPLFNDKFKAALAGTADRKQQQLDTFTAFGSDDDEVIAAPLRTATAYKPPPRCVCVGSVERAGGWWVAQEGGPGEGAGTRCGSGAPAPVMAGVGGKASTHPSFTAACPPTPPNPTPHPAPLCLQPQQSRPRSRSPSPHLVLPGT